MTKELTDIIHKITLGYPSRLRDDLKQECWLTALERLHKYEPEKGTLYTFMHSRLNGVCKDYLKKHDTRHEELSECLLTEEPKELILKDLTRPLSVTQFIRLKISHGYTPKEIFEDFKAIHNYKSLKSIYNHLN